MEASKCPKCGDEPEFLEHVDKWYCFGCNTYVEDEVHEHEEAPTSKEPVPAHEDHATAIESELKALEGDHKDTCASCGAVLEVIGDGKKFCFVCESYPGELGPKTEHVPNEAQALIDAVSKPVETPAEEIKPVPEIVEVKPAPTPPPEKPKEISEAPARPKAAAIKMCQVCGQPLKFIEKYQRHYCYGCRKYAPREAPAMPAAAPKKAEPGAKKCPECGGSLKLIEKYNEHYCYVCKKYPFHKKKADVPAKPKELCCRKCGGQLKFIEKYQRHYCFECKEYAPKGSGADSHGHEKKKCPACDEEMKFVSEYNEWYCYKCKKYSLRPSKPVLLA